MEGNESVFIYFDGSVKENEGGGIGYVIKSIGGKVIYKDFDYIDTENSMIAEAKALKSAVEYVSSYSDISVLFIKGDNETIIECIENSNRNINGGASKTISKIKNMLDNFDTVNASCVSSREFNNEADFLSKKGRLK